MQAHSSLSLLNGFAYYLIENNLLDEKNALDTLKTAENEKTSYILYLTKKKILRTYVR